MESKGIEVYDTSLKGNQNLDLPALDSRILKPLQDKNTIVVIDAGGDPKGSLVLRRFKNYIVNSENYFVVNANRTETNEAQKVIDYIDDIESYSNLRVTKLLNTTHMLKSTTKEDVIKGYKLCKQVEEIRNLELKYNVCIENVYKQLKEDKDESLSELKEKLFPIKLYFRDQWML